MRWIQPLTQKKPTSNTSNSPQQRERERERQRATERDWEMYNVLQQNSAKLRRGQKGYYRVQRIYLLFFLVFFHTRALRLFTHNERFTHELHICSSLQPSGNGTCARVARGGTHPHPPPLRCGPPTVWMRSPDAGMPGSGIRLDGALSWIFQ